MRKLLIALLFAAAAFGTGCATVKWEPSWAEAEAPNPTPESKKLMVEARAKFNHADDRLKLLDSILAYHAVLKEDPANSEALAFLGNQYILLGTAYTDSRGDKSDYFRLAMKYCELAMYTNPEFKKAVDAGRKPWEAADTLGSNELHAMLFWTTAMQYDFKEGMTIIGKIANIGWMKYGLAFLDRITAVDPEFGGGAVEFGKTICYFALPKSKGGDKKLGQDYMLAATKKRNDWMFGRWARGKYYNVVMDNKKGVEEDLKWVATRDIEKYQDPYPWRVHFRDDARQILSK